MPVSGGFLVTFTLKLVVFFSAVINGVFSFIAFFVFLEYIKAVFLC